jgi:hypothetical protein
MLCVKRAQVEKAMGITPRHQTRAENMPKAPLEGGTEKTKDLPTGVEQPRPLIITQPSASTEVVVVEDETQPPQTPSNTQ